MAVPALRILSLASTLHHRRSNALLNLKRHIRRKASTRDSGVTMVAPPSYSGRCFTIYASKSPNAEDSDNSFALQEDLSFLLKLGVGSFVGAAIIKYGSIVLPAITRPNLTQALIMISSPVFVALLLLIKGSRVQP